MLMHWTERRKRLPDEGIQVLAFVTNSQCFDVNHKMQQIFLVTKRGPRWTCQDGLVFANKEVTHWMPLPDDPPDFVAMTSKAFMGKKR